ncbi:hypothetical protein CRE_17258 [Caenorhabditis remanei]|uniref:Uncharacterized protein n=1 Tax=Caenorhabditis remanei TaxID=31234 RepID=E3MAE1_CAERE|nr:hypothetical protein CRE_17258 [Caenorhabditis remanei]
MVPIELTQDESDALNAMETCMLHKELIGQHLGSNSVVLPMTPERMAVLQALLNQNAILSILPTMLSHIGVDFYKCNIFDVINYVSGFFYEGDRLQPRVRILDPTMLVQYGVFCDFIGTPINIFKIWYEFSRRYYPNLHVMQTQVLQAAQQIDLMKLVNVNMVTGEIQGPQDKVQIEADWLRYD